MFFSSSARFRIRTAWALAITAMVVLLMSMTPFAFAATGGPTVTLTTTSPTSTSASSIPVTAVFSEAVNGFVAGDISKTNATIANFAAQGTSSAAFTFNIMPIATGTVTVMVPADIASSTAATSTGNQASNVLSFLSTAPAATSTSTSTPLALNSVTTVRSNATADNTFTNGWEWVLHFTIPATESAFRMKFSDFMSNTGSSSIPTASNIRIFSPQSSNATDAGSAITETDNRYGDWLMLTGDTSASTSGRQIDLTVQVRIPTGTVPTSYTTTFGAQSVQQSATSTTPR